MDEALDYSLEGRNRVGKPFFLPGVTNPADVFSLQGSILIIGVGPKPIHFPNHSPDDRERILRVFFLSRDKVPLVVYVAGIPFKVQSEESVIVLQRLGEQLNGFSGDFAKGKISVDEIF